MSSWTIPARVIGILSEIYPKIFTGSEIETRFLSGGAPDFKSNWSCSKREKVIEWLRICNRDINCDKFSLLDYLIEQLFEYYMKIEEEDRTSILKKIHSSLDREGLHYSSKSGLAFTDRTALSVRTAAEADPHPYSHPPHVVPQNDKLSPGIDSDATSNELKPVATSSHLGRPVLNEGQRIFIGHSSLDHKFVNSLTDFLETGITGLAATDIVCTSVEGLGVGPGDQWAKWIQERLEGTEIYLCIPSSNFINSFMCILELGACWILSKRIVVLLPPNQKIDDLPKVLQDLQIKSSNESTHLDDIRDLITESLKIDAGPTARWSEKKKQFLSSIEQPTEQSQPD
ncbi:MAG: hypothetical protein AAGI30_13205 [Planctomycetota bacterium]